MSHRLGYRILFWASCLCLPASLLSAVIVLNIVNPMAIGFLTRFEVVNESGVPVRITPVGVFGSEGQRRPLPFSMSRFLSIPSLKDRSFSLGVGSRRSFTYDWDDIQFAEILIVPRSGPARELVVDPTPTQNQYRRPATNYFVIPQLASLPAARKEVLAVLETPGNWFFWVVIMLGFVAPIGIKHARRKLRNSAPKPPK